MGQYNPMVITFAIYLCVVLLVGIAAYFATKNFDDFVLGGRRLGSFVTAMSAGASDMSGWLLMGVPGAVYSKGLGQTWIALGVLWGAYANWRLVAARLRLHTKKFDNALTIPDFFRRRFGSEKATLSIASAVIILFFFTIYCASGIVAGAKLFQNLFHLTYVQAMWLSTFATIVYTFLGGFLAVSWSDSIQASLMFFALILTPVMVVLHLGDFSQVSLAIAAASAQAGTNLSSLVDGVPLVVIVSGMAWGLGYFGQPHILARFMASESVKTVERSRRIGMTWMLLCLTGAVAVGYLGIAYFGIHPEQEGMMENKKEDVFIVLSMLLYNPWLAGVIISAIFAAIMSTLSCQLLVSSSAITQDFYKGFLRPNAPSSELVWVGRIMVLCVAVIAILIASNPNSSILDLVEYAWGGFGAAFGPLVLLSVYWKRANYSGALAGMVTGALTSALWKPVTGSGLYEILPGFILGFVACVAVSLLTSPPKREIVERFEEADSEFRQEMAAYKNKGAKAPAAK